jgi:hemolysin activation/secretion protein
MYLLQRVSIGIIMMSIVFSMLPNAYGFESSLDTQEAVKEIERKQMETERKLREKEQQEKSRQSITEPEAEHGEESVKFMIKEIVLENDQLLGWFEERDLIKPYINREISMNDINTLMIKITNTLIHKGYITTRVKIPLGQNLKSGKLVLHILIGFVEEITPEPNTLRKQMQVFNAFPFLVHKPLDINDLDYGIEQMNKVRSGNATIKIEPGNEMGGSKIIVTNDARNPASLDIGMDNLGQKETGLYREKATFSLDNIASLNDTFFVDYVGSLVDDAHRKKSTCYTVSYSFPLGYWTLGLMYSHSDYLRYIEGLNTEFAASGNTTSLIPTLDRIIWRDKFDRIKFKSSLAIENQQNYIQDALVDTSSKKLTVGKVGLEYSGFVFGGFSSISVMYDKGLNILNAYTDPSSLSSDTPRAQFDKYEISATWNKDVMVYSQKFGFLFSGNGQYAEKTLYNSEQLCIGDMNTVRGFRGGAAAGDRGYYLRTDVSASDFSRFWDYLKGVRLFVGYDVGYVRASSSVHANYGEGEAYLSGWSTGFNYYTNIVNINVTYSRKIYATPYVKSNSQEVYVVATTSVTGIGEAGYIYLFSK